MKSNLLSKTTLITILLSSIAMADAPSAPINAGAYAFTDNGARLSFKDTDANETGFRIYQFAPTDAGIISTADAKDGADTYQYATLSGLEESTLYGVNIVAYRDDGLGGIEESAPLTKWFRTIAPPPTPAMLTNIGVYAATDHSIRMSGLDNADNEDGFKMYDRDGNLLGVLPANPGVNEYTYANITGLDTCTLYTVYIVAFNVHGESERTEKSFMTTGCSTPLEVPLAPSSVAVYNITSDSARISFMDNSNNEQITGGFVIYAIDTDTNTSIEMASLPRNRYPKEYQYANLTNLSADTLYTIRVVSKNGAGEGSAELKQFRTLP